MTIDRVEEITMANALAIAELSQLAKQTSKDVDKLIMHLDEVLPIRGKVHALENDVRDLEESRKKWTWFALSTLSSLALGLLYILVKGV